MNGGLPSVKFWTNFYPDPKNLGFYFAKPTTFKNPMFEVQKVDYYAIDHTPSYLWESVLRSISAALVVHLPAIAGGPESWQKNETIHRAINIDGCQLRIKNAGL
jgi:alanine dehydrogenase